METLIEVKEKLNTFISNINDMQAYPVVFRKVRSQAKAIVETLDDPFVIWGEDSTKEILPKLEELKKELKGLRVSPNHRDLANATSELIKYITIAQNQYHTSNINDEFIETTTEASGLIRQLNVRQEELNYSIAKTLQQIDERTGAAERQVNRVERASIQNIRQATSELREIHSDSVKAQIRDGLDEINNTLNTASSKLDNNIREATDNLLKRHQEDYDSLYRELNNSTKEQIKQSDDLRLDFERKVTDLNRVVDEQAKDLNDRFEAEQQSFKESLLKAIKDEVSNYQTTRSLLKEQLQEAKDIVGILSKKAMAHEHLKQARHEAYAYWGFQTSGLLFLFLAILMSVAMFGDSLGLRLPWLTWLVEFSSSNGAIQLHITGEDIAAGGSAGANIIEANDSSSEAAWFFKRISIVLLLTAPGLYLLKEAANHRAKENLYRQRGIQLASITPYLKELDESERNAIKKDLVKSFFSFHDGKADTQNVPDFLRDLKETTKIIRSIDRATQPTHNNRSFVKRRRRQPQTARS